MHAINTNPITVICETNGCGKTTQVPQFLYEAGYGDPDCFRSSRSRMRDTAETSCCDFDREKNSRGIERGIRW